MPPPKKDFQSGQKKFGEMTKEFQEATSFVQQHGLKYERPEDIPDTEIPESLDYRNIMDYDFTGNIRDQAACGSCYTMGFI